jgi:spermidine/putrescine-binding protein
MSEFSERLVKSFKQALEIAKGTAKPGTYRITTYDDDGKPTVIADISDEFMAEIDAEIAAEEAESKQAEAQAVAPSKATQKDQA